MSLKSSSNNIQDITENDLFFLNNYWYIVKDICFNKNLSDNDCASKLNDLFFKKIDITLNTVYYMNFKMVSTIITNDYIVLKKNDKLLVIKHLIKDIQDHTVIYNMLVRYNHPMNEDYEINCSL